MPIDYKQYHPKWKKISEFIRFYRAKNKCEKCLIPNYSIAIRGKWNGKPVWQNDDGHIFCAETGKRVGENYVGDLEGNVTYSKVVLTVSHQDHDKSNNSFFNLKALCQRCHLIHDKEIHAKNRKATINKRKGLIELF